MIWINRRRRFYSIRGEESMDFSIIAINRVLENAIKEGQVSVTDLRKRFH